MRLLITWLLCTAACSGSAARSDVQPPRKDLTGVWNVAVRFGSARTSGVVALFQSRILADSFGFQLVDGVTHGTYDIDFQPLGFRLVGGAALQPATSTLRGDSVEVVLNPYVGHGRIVMVGVLTHEMVAGEWTYDGPGGGSGTFELTRHP